MSDNISFQHRPAEFKTSLDGDGGLVRVQLVGAPHDGRELYIDEMELPTEIFATSGDHPFEWWPASLQEAMAGTATGGDAAAPPVRYVLKVDDNTREPLFVAEAGAR
jgi:hypothetical protein